MYRRVLTDNVYTFMTMAQTMQTMCTPKKDKCCRIWKSEWFSTQDKLYTELV